MSRIDRRTKGFYVSIRKADRCGFLHLALRGALERTRYTEMLHQCSASPFRPTLLVSSRTDCRFGAPAQVGLGTNPTY